MSPQELSVKWRGHVETLRTFGATSQAQAVEQCAAELERALALNDDELLTRSQAAAFSGYSADHLGRLMRQGSLRNMGKTRAPLFRRKDLPRKRAGLPLSASNLHLLGADPRQVAKAVVTSRQGER